MKNEYGKNKFERRVSYLKNFFNDKLNIIEKSNNYFEIKGKIENNDYIFIETYFTKLNYVKKLDKFVIDFDNVSYMIWFFKNQILDVRNFFNENKIILKLNKKYIKNVKELEEAASGFDDFKIIKEIDLILEKHGNFSPVNKKEFVRNFNRRKLVLYFK